ncbi:MAG: hypothetical protein HOD87_05160 [Gammaproteobacteria bacterium]|nr:hypothetical protein [Gammaproteobacteria bacterium]
MTSVLILDKIDRYFDAGIDYMEEECLDRSYLYYKLYDDQIEERRESDRKLRSERCLETTSEYYGGW